MNDRNKKCVLMVFNFVKKIKFLKIRECSQFKEKMGAKRPKSL